MNALSQPVVFALIVALAILLYRFKTNAPAKLSVINHRRLPRHPVVVPIQVARNGRVARGLTHDMSLQGCRINTDLQVRLGQRLALQLYPTGEKPISMEAATVRWATADEFGVQFMSLESTEKARLKVLLGSQAVVM